MNDGWTYISCFDKDKGQERERKSAKFQTCYVCVCDIKMPSCVIEFALETAIHPSIIYLFFKYITYIQTYNNKMMMVMMNTVGDVWGGPIQ